MRFLKHFWIFFTKRKKFWFTPIIFVILVLLVLFNLAKDDKSFYRFLLSEKYNIQEIYLQKSNNFTKNQKNFQIKKCTLDVKESLVFNS